MRRLPVAAPTPAAAWAGAVGVVGLCLAWLLTRGSVRLLTVLVAVIAVLAVVAGMVGTARAMFLSQHGFSVAVLVAATAGVVALAAALAVAGALGRWSRGLREEARRFGQNGQFVAAQTLPTELRAVADDPARYHRQIRAEVDRMVRLVDELFEFSRIQAGLMRLTLQPVELGDVVSDAMAAVYPLARAEGVLLGGRVAPGLRVNADPAELSRVVSNLLLNAIRHTPPDGVVEVSGQAIGPEVEFAVRDACGGISPSDLERVFDVAWQGDSARTPQPHTGRGAGIGLAIVKGVVEAHHGRVRVANSGPGCAFVVTLPG